MGFCFLILLWSCKKDTDTQSPSIVINAPGVNASFSVMDSMHLNIQVSDNTLVKWIKVSLVNENRIPVVNELDFQPNAAIFIVDKWYGIHNVSLNTGIYYLSVMASDGVNQTSSYHPVYITGIPQKLMGIIGITKNLNQIHIIKADSASLQQNLVTSNSDLIVSAVNSNCQLLFWGGKYSLPLAAFDLAQQQNQWTLSNQASPPFPYFENLYLAPNNLLYISFNNGDLKGFTSSGSQVFTASSIETNWIPTITFLHGSYLICDKKSMLGQQDKVCVYTLSTGYLLQQLPLNAFSTVGMATKAPNFVYLIGNENAVGAIKLYSIVNNSFANVATAFNQAITRVEVLDQTHLLIAGTNDVFVFDMISESLNAIITGKTARQIRINSLNNDIYLAGPTSIEVYSWPGLSMHNPIAFSDTLTDFHLLYNK